MAVLGIELRMQRSSQVVSMFENGGEVQRFGTEAEIRARTECFQGHSKS